MAQDNKEPYLKQFTNAFADMRRLPPAFWIIVITFAVESMAYFGMLHEMVPYLLGLDWSAGVATMVVSIFTGLVTLFMLGAGSYAEGFGLRRAIIFATVLCAAGRFAFAYSAKAGNWNLETILVLGSFLIVALGEGILQPVCYSGVKQYSDEKTSSMGYGLIYAVMNVGIIVIGAIAVWVRPAIDKLLAGAPASGMDQLLTPILPRVDNGFEAINWISVAINIMAFLGFMALFTSRREATKLRPDSAESLRKEKTLPVWARVKAYFTEGPFTNTRFLFFIFMLLPVRTLFAHQWLTLPTYILRAYSKDVQDWMEAIVMWTNPAIIAVAMPVATAATRHLSVYRVMVIGSLISALPTFLLCAPPNIYLLLAYLVIFSIGEAIWSGRFLEYASELAPEGKIAQYMGLANIPWLLAKTTTGFYAGFMLDKFCPPGAAVGEMQTAKLWGIYGLIAMASPIGLWLARNWVKAGLNEQTSERKAAQ
jgi:proton-dependent oligopeptide transporter, POT family